MMPRFMFLSCADHLKACNTYVHIMPLLHSLDWLRVPERIEFRSAVLMYRCLHGRQLIWCMYPTSHGSDFALQRLQRWLVVATIGDCAFTTSCLEQPVRGSAVGHITASVLASPEV